MSLPALDEATLDEIYQWLDTIPFSRERKNMPRDFSDGVLIAELVAHFLPRYVDLHNYPTVNSAQLKKYNWATLNKMVLSNLNFHVPTHIINQIVDLVPGAVEYVLCNLRIKIELAISERKFKPRRYRSRSSMRADSSLSLNSYTSDDESTSMSLSTNRCQHHLPKRHNVNLNKFSVSAPSSAREQLCEDLVPARVLHTAQQDLLQKDEQIQNLYSRIRHLERLVHLKDDRIAQLTQRLDRLAQAYYQKQRANQPVANEQQNQHKVVSESLLLVKSLLQSATNSQTDLT